MDIQDTQLQGRRMEHGLGRINTMLPENLLHIWSQLRPCLVEGLDDLWVWKSTISWEYSVGSAYMWLMGRGGGLSMTVEGTWSWIWRFKLPANANIQFFHLASVKGTIVRTSLPRWELGVTYLFAGCWWACRSRENSLNFFHVTSC